jgi:hypothetical protein
MTDELQEALRGTLKAGSQDVPAPEPNLLDQLARRHRARRRIRAVATATATVTAVLVVLGGPDPCLALDRHTRRLQREGR